MPNAKLPAVYILATLDTKGVEAAYVVGRLRQCGIATRLVDVGCLGEPRATADIARSRVFAAAGADLKRLARGGDRGRGPLRLPPPAPGRWSPRIMRVARSLACWRWEVRRNHDRHCCHARTPWGVPKLNGQHAGVRACAAIRRQQGYFHAQQRGRHCGSEPSQSAGAGSGRPGDGRARRLAADTAPACDKPLIAATMFGVTTPCVERAREVLEQGGCEVVVFHATGSGGEAMESAHSRGIDSRRLGYHHHRNWPMSWWVAFFRPVRRGSRPPAERGVPQVVSVGATDMVNFYGPESVPEKFRGRQFHAHNANVTLMRTTPAEEFAVGGRNRPQSGPRRADRQVFFSRFTECRPSTARARCSTIRWPGRHCSQRSRPTGETSSWSSSTATSTIRRSPKPRPGGCSNCWRNTPARVIGDRAGTAAATHVRNNVRRLDGPRRCP